MRGILYFPLFIFAILKHFYEYYFSRDFQFGSQLDDYEMDKIRCLMAQVDGNRRTSGISIPSSHRGSIEPSLMSTVFAVVFFLIISISVYAFASLFNAVIKRMNP